MKKGFLVTFEGGEGCGKSTQIKLFTKYLEEHHIDYVLSREPGGTELGNKLREILLHSKESMNAATEFFIFSAGRSDHVENIIMPALEQGKVVVLDRFYDSSYAYQGYAGDLPVDEMKRITKLATSGIVPDLTILLDISYDEGFGRKSIDESLKNLDRIESKGREYHDKVRAGYLQLAKDEPNRIKVVDASKSKEEVFKNITKLFEEKYNK